jgi:hypothetical protein
MKILNYDEIVVALKSPIRVSALGFPSDFGFRISDFNLCC